MALQDSLHCRRRDTHLSRARAWPGVAGRARAELARRARFDLEPSEFAALQRTGILTLGRDQLEIRTTPDGTVYYRDYERPFEPNTPTGDNLLSLPRYKHADL